MWLNLVTTIINTCLYNLNANPLDGTPIAPLGLAETWLNLVANTTFLHNLNGASLHRAPIAHLEIIEL
jgi:hypothetical protein